MASGSISERPTPASMGPRIASADQRDSWQVIRSYIDRLQWGRGSHPRINTMRRERQSTPFCFNGAADRIRGSTVGNQETGRRGSSFNGAADRIRGSTSGLPGASSCTSRRFNGAADRIRGSTVGNQETGRRGSSFNGAADRIRGSTSGLPGASSCTSRRFNGAADRIRGSTWRWSALLIKIGDASMGPRIASADQRGR